MAKTKAIQKETSKKGLLKWAAWDLLGKMSSMALQLIFNILLARILMPEDLGGYFIIVSFIQIGAIFLIFGMDRISIKYISQNYDGETLLISPSIKKIGFAILSGIITLPVVMLLSKGTTNFFEYFFELRLEFKTTILITLWLTFYALNVILVNVYRGLSLINWATVFDKIINTLVAVTLLVSIAFYSEIVNLESVLICLFIGVSVNFLTGFFFLIRLTKNIKIESTKNSKKEETKNLFLSLWNMNVVALLLTFMSIGSIWILGYYQPKSEVAIYGMVTRLVLPLAALLAITNRVTSAEIGKLVSLGNNTAVEKMIRTTATFTGVLALAVLVVLIIFGKLILGVLFGEHFVPGYYALLLIGGAQVINVLTGLPGVLLIMTGNERKILVSSIISISIAIILAFLLVKPLSYNGLAISTATGLILHNVIMLLICRYKLKINTFFDVNSLQDIKRDIRYRIADKATRKPKFQKVESLIRKVENFWYEKIRGIEIIECFGDSHTKVFRYFALHRYFPKHYMRVLSVQGATSFGLGNPNSKTNALKLFEDRLINNNRKIIFLLGEVDLGFLIWYKAEKKGLDPYDLTREALNKYYEFLEKNIIDFTKLLIVSSPLPTIKDGDTSGPIMKMRSGIKATQIEKTELTLFFNSSLKGWAKSKNVGFIDLDAITLDETTGLVKSELLNKEKVDHHYDKTTYAKKLFEEISEMKFLIN